MIWRRRRGVTGFHTQSSAGLVERNDRKIVIFIEQVGKCGNGPTSMLDDVFLGSNERHERTLQYASAHLDSLVGLVASARGVEMVGWGRH